ncbi:MAG TPA: lipid-A-disaccharide synthase [Verrucomicrobiales bacterium]|nr:lipid-A-disaccharide synthase [Verrucomicrobiales bacterium]
MPPRSFMLIAGEASGDRLAAGLVTALRDEWWRKHAVADQNLQPLHKGFGPVFFGAGGDAMRAARVEIVEDMTRHAVIGLSDVLKKVGDFARLMRDLADLAERRMPDVIICVDFGGFNLRFASEIRKRVKRRAGPFNTWAPKIVQFVSPQVWGSRPRRALRMERDLDLLISLYPFEREWFARRAPRLRVAFVGHPLAEKTPETGRVTGAAGGPPLVALLPGSRTGELRRHLPVMLAATRLMQQTQACRFSLVVPSEALAAEARRQVAGDPVEVRCGGLREVLALATLAISKTGTIATELALHGVPAVTLYKTSWPTYVIGRRIVKVKWLSMPNILADEELFPEFVQGAATPEAIAHAAVGLLRDESRRRQLSQRLQQTVAALHNPDANGEAARAVLDLFQA